MGKKKGKEIKVYVNSLWTATCKVRKERGREYVKVGEETLPLVTDFEKTKSEDEVFALFRLNNLYNLPDEKFVFTFSKNASTGYIYEKGDMVLRRGEIIINDEAYIRHHKFKAALGMLLCSCGIVMTPPSLDAMHAYDIDVYLPTVTAPLIISKHGSRMFAAIAPAMRYRGEE